MCYAEEEFIAYLDNELTVAQASALKNHLHVCDACRTQLAGLESDCLKLKETLGEYRRAADALPVSPEALGRVLQNISGGASSATGSQRTSTSLPGAPDNLLKQVAVIDRQPLSRKEGWTMKTSRKIMAWAAVAAIMVGVFGFTPAKTVAAQFLSIFRMDKVEVLHFNPQDLQQMQQALQGLGPVDLENFGRVEAEPNGEYRQVSSKKAEAEAGFNVLLPQTLGDYTLEDNVFIEPGNQVTITPDVKGINEFLSSLGSKTMLPQEIDDRSFTIELPSVVRSSYMENNRGSVSLTMAPSPRITAPDGVNVNAIRDALLAVPILPANIKNALEGVNNWQNTLIIPDFGGNTREVQVNGTQGVFISTGEQLNSFPEEKSNYAGFSSLAWPRNGVWMVLQGNLSLEQALTLANELK